MENNPTAPVEAPVEAPKSEATPNTTPTEAPAVDMHGFTSEQLAEMEKFFNSNGGFNAVKSKISNPQPQVVEQKPLETPVQPVAQPVMQQPTVAEGYITPAQIASLQYRNMLAGEERYSEIKDYITKGEFIDEMGSMGMSAVDANGNMNDVVIKKFLDLKAQTMRPVATSAPAATPTPTVEYVNVGEQITSRDDAMRVLGQNGHPMHEAAIKYLSEQVFKK